MLAEKVSLGGEVAEFAETFVRHTRGELAGQTIDLRPFQKEILNGLNLYGKGRAGRYATTLTEEAANYATRNFPNRILKTKITPLELEVGKKVFHQLEPEYTDEGVKTKRLRKNIKKFTRNNYLI